jgi:hypothetical protein
MKADIQMQICEQRLTSVRLCSPVFTTGD